ncbi:MAG: patatin family protein [Oscillospiraceae bacterium]|nr:patatin family protein [Oscillospiraceae bacterium]
MKTGIVDVGGGMRGIYACGVMDYCMEHGINFDLGIGVSAGAANICTFLAGQKCRNYMFYTEYNARKESMSLSNLVRKGSYIDMDYIYGKLSNADGEYPFDFDALLANPTELLVVAENAITGEAKYFTKDYISQDNLDIVKASCSIPYVNKPYYVDGEPYFDGALGDPVPVEKAISMGCDRVVLILSKPRDVLRLPKRDIAIAKRIRKEYPVSAERISGRADHYNSQLETAKKLEAEGKVLILAPDDTCGVDTLTKEKEPLDKLYQKGIRDAEKIPPFLA